MKEYIKVEQVQVLTLTSPDKDLEQQTLPFLRFILENGSDFLMSNIPTEIAISISVHIQGAESPDSRLQIHELVGQLAIVKDVKIDAVVPGTGVYQATITLLPEGFTNPISFQMIPSNATLLAVINDSPIYISTQLWKEYIESKADYTIKDASDEL